MFARTLPALLAPLLVFATWVSLGALEAADDLSDLQPGTKVIVQVDGESVAEVIEKVAPDVYRVRVKIRTGQVIEPALSLKSLRLAPADAIVGAAPTKPNADPAPSSATGGTVTPGTVTSGTATVTPGTVTPGTVTPGTVTPGTVTPGTVTPGTVTPGRVTPGRVTPGTVTRGTVQGTVTVTPGTVTPGRVTPGTVTPGKVTQGTTPPVTISEGTVTPGTVTPGTVTPGTVVPGTATAGSATSGTVTVTPGAVRTNPVATPGASTPGPATPVAVPEVPLAETPAGKAELQSLVGVWNVASLRRGGRALPGVQPKITITPTSIALEKLVFDQVRLDPTSLLRRMDLAKVGLERPTRAIYERDGDRLRICLTPGEDSIRPTEFETTAGDGRILYECELAK